MGGQRLQADSLLEAVSERKLLLKLINFFFQYRVNLGQYRAIKVQFYENYSQNERYIFVVGESEDVILDSVCDCVLILSVVVVGSDDERFDFCIWMLRPF